MPSENYFDFMQTLVDCGLLYPGEGEVLARTHRDNQGKLDWYGVVDICATRAAHKEAIDV